MSAVKPFEALWFFAADDIDEVNREYAKWMVGKQPLVAPDLTYVVRVIAVEYIVGHGDYVWLLHEGMVLRREAWMVRAWQ